MIFKLKIDPNASEEVIATVHRRTPLINEIERLVSQEVTPDRLPGYREDEIIILALTDIECFAVEREKTFAICRDKQRYTVRRKLYELEELLPENFERISKSAIGNMDQIVKFKVQLSGAVDAVFGSGYTECISRRCFAELKRRYGL
ncbi:MAG: LytTR family transcriptional regulator DNA-binding domain-containing protein [Eubacteriales bacterium]|nr:LytTR family transcriptional regulator DNA-binding domain-containing protein [Eubacteriales bacterium]